jgi:hypothetical protein
MHSHRAERFSANAPHVVTPKLKHGAIITSFVARLFVVDARSGRRVMTGWSGGA